MLLRHFVVVGEDSVEELNDLHRRDPATDCAESDDVTEEDRHFVKCLRKSAKVSQVFYRKNAGNRRKRG